MKETLEDLPDWAARALQGVTHWIGHRRCLYRDYPLSEGALIAETCNLIYGNLPHLWRLRCEVQYSSFIGPENMHPASELPIRARVDLVIDEKSTKDGESIPKFIIEVKRASAPPIEIDKDLRRLLAARRACPRLRTFLFVIAEARRPTRFVSEQGKSYRGKQKIPHSDGHYRVRRTWKAAHALTRIERAQYACLIEVYS